MGKDSVKYYNSYGYYQEFQTIQLDEVAEISGTIRSEEFENTNISLSGKLLIHLYLAENIGIVTTQEHVELSMKGTISDENGSVRINISITVDDELNLDSFFSPTPVIAHSLKKRRSEVFQRIQGKLPLNMGNIVQQVMGLVKQAVL